MTRHRLRAPRKFSRSLDNVCWYCGQGKHKGTCPDLFDLTGAPAGLTPDDIDSEPVRSIDPRPYPFPY